LRGAACRILRRSAEVIFRPLCPLCLLSLLSLSVFLVCLCVSVPLWCSYFFFFSILAQVSRNVTARLNTSAPGAESLSTQKYPSRSNW
jgi:hypothetical protein